MNVAHSIDYVARSTPERLQLGSQSEIPYGCSWPIAPCRTATARSSNYADSIPPESLESIRYQVRIAHRVRDVLVTEVVLQ